jgi:hypothetical protein
LSTKVSSVSPIPARLLQRECQNSSDSGLPFSIPSSESINASRRSSRTSSWGAGWSEWMASWWAPARSVGDVGEE